MGLQDIIERMKQDGFDESERHYARRMLCIIVQNELDIGLNSQPSSKSALCCPNCRSKNYVRHGKDKKGRQRYRCKSCRSTFTESSGKPLSSSRLPFSTWKRFIECHVTLLNLRETADRCNISLKTAFQMRHRLLAIIEDRFRDEDANSLRAKPAPSASKAQTSIQIVLPATSSEDERIIINQTTYRNASLATNALARESLKLAAAKKSNPDRISPRMPASCSRFIARFRHTTVRTKSHYHAWHRWIQRVKLAAFAYKLAMITVTKARTLASHGPLLFDFSIAPLARLFAEYAPPGTSLA